MSNAVDTYPSTEVVGDKAVTFRKGDIDDLREKLQNMLDMVSLVNGYKKSTTEYILEKYNWNGIAKKLWNYMQNNAIAWTWIHGMGR